jgi:hypothetical protein
MAPVSANEEIQPAMRKKSINWGESIVPLLALAFGAAYFFQTRDAPIVALYWPIIIGIVAGSLWIAVVVKFAFFKKDVTRQTRGNLSDIIAKSHRTAIVLVCSAGYLIAVPWLGFSLSNFIFMLVLFRCLGSQRWLQNCAVALGIAVFLHVALITFMKLSLPQLNLGIIFL